MKVNKKRVEQLARLFTECNGEEICTAIAMINFVSNALLVQLASSILFNRIKESVCDKHKENH
jgi:hypothetical protein